MFVLKNYRTFLPCFFLGGSKGSWMFFLTIETSTFHQSYVGAKLITTLMTGIRNPYHGYMNTPTEFD